MTEDKAKEAKRLVELLENARRIPDKIQRSSKPVLDALDGTEGVDHYLLELSKIARELADEYIRTIERDLRAL